MKKLITFSLFFSAIVISAYNPIGAQEVKKAGVMDSSGKWIIPPVYDDIISPDRNTDIDTSFMTAIKDGHVGVIDIRNNILIPFKYKEYGKNTDSAIELMDENGKWGAIDKGGNIIVPFEYDDVNLSLSEEYPAVVKKGGKYGCIDTKTKKIILPCRYKYLYSEGNIIHAKNDLEHYALFDFSGKQLTEFIFPSTIYVYSRRLTPDKVIITKKEENPGNRRSYSYTYCDTQGKRLTPKYDDIDKYYGDMYCVSKGGKKAMIDSLAQTVLPLEYDQIVRHGLFKNKLIAKKNGKWGVMDTKNKEVIPFVYDNILSNVNDDIFFSEQDESYAQKSKSVFVRYEEGKLLDSDIRLATKKNGKWGVIDIQNKEIIPFLYDDIFWGGQNFCLKKDGRWTLINPQGKTLFDETYSEMRRFIDFHGNYLEVEKNGKWGVIDSLGTVLLPFEYDEIEYSDYNDIFKVTIGEKEGLVKNGGHVLLPIEYDGIDYLFEEESNYLEVEKNGKTEIIRRSDYKVVLLLSDFDEMNYSNSDITAAAKNGKWGLIDLTNGKPLTEFIYEDVSYSSKAQTAIVKVGLDKNDPFSVGYGLINSKGETILPPEYSRIDQIDGNYFIVKHIEGE